MHDVFISYSRRDAPIVRELHQALAERERDTWVDWNDIHPSAEWLHEIETAIGDANAFVFVLSPDALASEICGKELERAVHYGKRLIPVVCRDVDTSSVPESLARLQWIFLRSRDELDDALDRILHALDVDPIWLRAHTEHLSRARAWDESDRDASKLLRGAALKEAEAWLSDASGREPAPSGLHQRYIQASRQGESRRLRRLLSASAITLVLLAVLAVWANLERSRAERQQAISKARALGAQAEQSRTERAALIERAGLLAVEAMHRLPVIEHDAALRRALARLPQPHFTLPGSGRLTFGPQPPRPVLLSRDGALLAHSDDREIVIRDLYRGQIVSRLGHASAVRDMLLTRDQSRLVSISEAGEIVVWSFPDGRVVKRYPNEFKGTSMAMHPTDPIVAIGISVNRTLSAVLTLNATDGASVRTPYVSQFRNPIQALRFSRDGGKLALRANDIVEVFDAASRQRQARLKHRNQVQDMDFSPDGTRVATASDSAAYIWELSSGELLHRVRVGVTTNAVRFSTRHAELVTADIDGVATLWDTTRFCRIREFKHQGPIKRVQYSPDEELLMTASNDGTVRIWDRTTGNEIVRAPHGVFIAHAAFSDDGERAVSVATDGGLRVWSPWPAERLRRLPRSSRPGTTRFTGDGEHMVVRAGNGDWSVTSVDGRKLLRIALPKPASRLAVSPDESLVAFAQGDNTVRVYRVESGELLHALPHDDMIHALAFSPDSSSIATGTLRKEALRLWRIADGSMVWQRPQESWVSAVAFSPDGAQIAAALFDKHAFEERATPSAAAVRVWTAEGGEAIASLPHYYDVKALAFSPDGTRIATAGSDHVARLWRIDREQIERELEHQFPVQTVTFSANGQRIATGATDHFARVWDAGTGEELMRMFHDDAVGKVRFTDDDQTLRVVARPFVHRHPLNGDVLIDRICERLTRDLTPDERQRYLQGEHASSACSTKGSALETRVQSVREPA